MSPERSSRIHHKNSNRPKAEHDSAIEDAFAEMRRIEAGKNWLGKPIISYSELPKDLFRTQKDQSTSKYRNRQKNTLR